MIYLNKQQVLDADPKKIKKLILQQIQIDQEIQESISFLKKQKKLFQTFHKELEKFCKCVTEYNFIK